MNTKMIVGLGNPKCKFKLNRHNIGYRIIDAVILSNKTKSSTLKCKGREININLYNNHGSNLVLLKPTDWMNSSGISVGQAVDALRINPEDVLIIHDDFDFDFGTVRVKYNGGAGGHNGVKSVIENIGKKFSRIRIGIGRPIDCSPYDYVLSDFNWSEQKHFCELYNLCLKIVDYWVAHGVQDTMRLFNQK